MTCLDNKPTNLLNFAALSSWLIGGLFIATTAGLFFGQDFRGYYAATKVFLDGGNPYNYHVVSDYLFNITGWIGNNPYYYAPWFAWLIVPFALLPYELARYVWIFFNLALWNYSIYHLCILFDWPKVGWRRWLFFIISTFVFAWITLRYEQTGILLFALFVGGLIAIRKNNCILAGITLSLLLIKPNVTLLPVMAITIWLMRNHRWKPVISMIIVTIGLLFTSFVITPEWYKSLFEPGFGQGLMNVLDGPGQIVKIRINTTLIDWLTMFGIKSSTTHLVNFLLLLIGIMILGSIVWKSNSITEVAVFAILINFAITPYALQYDFPPLTIALLWALALVPFGRRKWFQAISLIIVIFITSVIFWERPISDGYWIIIGLITLTSLNRLNLRTQIPDHLL